MSRDPMIPSDEAPSGGAPVGVMDAVRSGWGLLMADFWPLWLPALVVYALQLAAGTFGAVPYIGACFAIAIGIFLTPPLGVGLYYVVTRRVQGGRAEVGQVFEGFRQRYWPSVVAHLPLLAVGVGVALVALALVLVILAGFGAFSGGNLSDEDAVAMVVMMALVIVPLVLLGVVAAMFFTFALLAVWDHPASGWEAAKASVRLVRGHFWSVLGFALLFALLQLAAALLGALACGVGIVFTFPVVMVWKSAATVYLYQSWTGRPVALPPAGIRAGGTTGGAIPPADVEPPPAP